MGGNDTVVDRRKLLKVLGGVGSGAVLTGYTETGHKAKAQDDGDEETHFGVSGPFADSITGTAWDGWDVPSVAGEFEARTGISVDVPYIGSDIDGFNQVQGGADYQFIIPDNVWVQRLGEADLAHPIDEDLFADELAEIPDWIKSHRTMFHDDTRYGIPPRWGVMGIIYNKNEIPEEDVEGWNVFWDEQYSDQTIIFDVPLFTVPNIVLYLEEQGELSLGLEDMSRDEKTEAVYAAVEDNADTIRQATVEMFDNARLLAGATSEANRPLLEGTAHAFNGFLLNYAQLKALEQDLGTDMIGFQPTPGLGGVFWIEGLTMTTQADTEELQNATNAWFKWVLSSRGQANVAWTENRKSAPTNYSATEFLSDEQQELLFMDQGKEIFENSIDYIPTNTDQWLELWEGAKQA